MHWQDDLQELGYRYLRLAVRVTLDDFDLAQSLFRFEEPRLLLALARMNDARLRALLSHSSRIFELADSFRVASVLCTLEQDPDAQPDTALPDAYRTEIVNFQYDAWCLIRAEARRDLLSCALTFGLRDSSILEQVAGLPCSTVHALARFPLLLSACRAPGLALMINLASADTVALARLSAAGLMTLAHERAPVGAGGTR